MKTRIEYVDLRGEPDCFSGTYVWSQEAKPGVYEAIYAPGYDGRRAWVRVGGFDDTGTRFIEFSNGDSVALKEPYGWDSISFRYLGKLDSVVLKIRKD